MSYHNYVITDGKFIGEFEEMYQSCNDPWHQSKDLTFSSPSRRCVSYFIERFSISSIVEWGCGLGNTVSYISKNTQRDVDILGVDISPTAIARAREKFPELKFVCDDIANIGNYSDYQCMFFSEITWYLLEKNQLNTIFEEMQRSFAGKNSYFIHNLVFYKGSEQKYGREYFTNLREFAEFCPFELLAKTEVDFEDESTVETSAIFRI